ncbi:MAG: NFACT RNA binding domain-containing protein [Desulfovibrio sp.]
MEANFFRHLAAEAGELLTGRRIEKIFGPATDVWTFRLQNKGGRLHLLYRPAKSAGLFFLSTMKPVNPANAPARVMWLRKRVSNRIILGCYADWINLRFVFELTPRKEPGHGKYMILDVRDDVRLSDELPDGCISCSDLLQPDAVQWPQAAQILDDKEIWRDYPQLSPPLRKFLKSKSIQEIDSTLGRLQAGSLQEFFMTNTPKGPEVPLLWDNSDRAEESKGNKEEIVSFKTALDAASSYGEQVLFPYLEKTENNPEIIKLKRERKKHRKLLKRLDEEELKLKKRIDLKVQAEALQAELWKLTSLEELPESIELNHPEHGPIEVPLDNQLSASGNMEKLFKLAAKGERGLVHLARRKNEAAKQQAGIEQKQVSLKNAETIAAGPNANDPQKPALPTIPKKYKNLAVALFTSSDGFLIIRGKNKKANHEILSKAASPFDYWFHLAGGPSSHIILKRDHPAQEVPDRTMEEAAILCGLKSFMKDSGKVDIMCALVKDVRKVKGFAHGQVMVDNVLTTLRVELERDLEERLEYKAP